MIFDLVRDIVEVNHMKHGSRLSLIGIVKQVHVTNRIRYIYNYLSNIQNSNYFS